MRLVAIEEHCRTGAVLKAAREESAAGPPHGRPGPWLEKVKDLGVGRLSDMDAGGVELQVLSFSASPVERWSGAAAVDLARAANDELAAAVAAHPKRFAAFAVLPTAEPAAAADELERAVVDLCFKGALINGRLGGRFLDDPACWPILERAEALDVPLYLHPAEPPQAVKEIYYAGFRPAVDFALGTAGWGWHIETGLHALRLILSGAFDRFPRLQVIIGHMGEALPFMLARSDDILGPLAGLERPLRDYFCEHFYITTSGFFTHPPLLCALMVLGADRILYAVDYPYAENEKGREFIETAPISPADREKIGHGNAERLLRLCANCRND